MMMMMNVFVLYNKKTTKYYKKSFFISKAFNKTRKTTFAHFDKHEKGLLA